MVARIAISVILASTGCGHPERLTVISVCDLSRDFTAYRDRLVLVRGVYFSGLRQQCPQSCATGDWPSFVDLIGSGGEGDAARAELDKAKRTAEREAKQGKRVEIWVTVRGNLKTSDHRSPAGPCDRVANSGFGHLGAFPAQIVVEGFSDVQVVPKANSPYDYDNTYRGAL